MVDVIDIGAVLAVLQLVIDQLKAINNITSAAEININDVDDIIIKVIEDLMDVIYSVDVVLVCYNNDSLPDGDAPYILSMPSIEEDPELSVEYYHSRTSSGCRHFR